MANIPSALDLSPFPDRIVPPTRNTRRLRTRTAKPRSNTSPSKTPKLPNSSAPTELNLQGGFDITPRKLKEVSSKPLRTQGIPTKGTQITTKLTTTKSNPRKIPSALGDKRREVKTKTLKGTPSTTLSDAHKQRPKRKTSDKVLTKGRLIAHPPRPQGSAAITTLPTALLPTINTKKRKRLLPPLALP